MPDGIREALEKAKAALPQEQQPQEPLPAQPLLQPDTRQSDASTLPQDNRGRVRTADEASLGSGDDAGADGDALMALQDGEDDSDAALAALVRRHRARRRAA